MCLLNSLFSHDRLGALLKIIIITTVDCMHNCLLCNATAEEVIETDLLAETD